MAQKKAGGSSSNGRDSRPNMYGVKKYGGEWVSPGHIIIRQSGSRVHGGEGVGTGKDFTLFALKKGRVRFFQYSKKRKIVSVIPA